MKCITDVEYPPELLLKIVTGHSDDVSVTGNAFETDEGVGTTTMKVLTGDKLLWEGIVPVGERILVTTPEDKSIVTVTAMPSGIDIPMVDEIDTHSLDKPSVCPFGGFAKSIWLPLLLVLGMVVIYFLFFRG